MLLISSPITFLFLLSYSCQSSAQVPAKVDVDVLMPADEPIELSGLKALGLQPGEQELPEVRFQFE